MSRDLKQTYLGDGLSAADDGDQVYLFCDRESGPNWVALDDRVFRSFLEYVAASRGLRIEVRRGTTKESFGVAPDGEES